MFFYATDLQGMAELVVPLVLLSAAAASYAFGRKKQSGGGALYDRAYQLNRYNPFKLHVFQIDAPQLDDAFLPKLDPVVPLPRTIQTNAYLSLRLVGGSQQGFVTTLYGRGELIAYDSEPHMLPPQRAGTCYLYTAMNAILNLPLLLDEVLVRLQLRMDTNPYSPVRKLKENSESSLTLTSTSVTYTAVARDNARALLTKLGGMPPGLQRWAQDKILHSFLKSAASDELRPGVYERKNAYGANENTALLVSTTVTPNKSGEFGRELRRGLFSRTRVDAANPAQAYTKFGSLGFPVTVLMKLLKGLGARVNNAAFLSHSAIFDNGTCVCIDTRLCSRATIRDALEWGKGWDRVGVLFSYSFKAGGHVAVYRRDQGRVRVLDSNYFGAWELDDYLQMNAADGMHVRAILPIFMCHVPQYGGGDEPPEAEPEQEETPEVLAELEKDRGDEFQALVEDGAASDLETDLARQLLLMGGPQ